MKFFQTVKTLTIIALTLAIPTALILGVAYERGSQGKYYIKGSEIGTAPVLETARHGLIRLLAGKDPVILNVRFDPAEEDKISVATSYALIDKTEINLPMRLSNFYPRD